MAFVSAQKSRILVGDFALSGYTKSVSEPWSCEMLDTTVLTDTSKTFIPGLDTSTLAVSGLYDTAEHADLASWRTTGEQAVTFGQSGLALGSELVMVNAFETSLAANSQVSGLAEFALAAQTDGASDMGVSLHDLTAVTADESGTGVDGAAATTNGGVAHLHVTAFSGFSGAVVIVEDSANNSTWATIGTFATVASATSERLVIAGTIRRYTRYSVDVTGSGSVTFSVGIARR